MEVKKHKADLDTQNPRKRQRIHKGTAIEELPDDIIVAILSRMNIKDAVRTSVLSTRWKYLWKFMSVTLEFHDKDIATRKKLEAFVNRVLELYNRVDSLVIRFSNTRKKTESAAIDKWIYSAMLKQVKIFELDLSADCGFHCSYEFPSFIKLVTQFHREKYRPILHKLRCIRSSLRYLSGFRSLRSIRLVDVDIQDEMVHYFLDSCPYIEQLCIRASDATKDLRVVDPLPNLKELKISDCCNLQSLVISATNLKELKISDCCNLQSLVISATNLKELEISDCCSLQSLVISAMNLVSCTLTLGGVFCKSFIYEPNKHSTYSDQLVKLVLNLQTENVQMESIERPIAPPDFHQFRALKQLELNIVSKVDRSLLFFTSLIEASPHLHEFKLKIDYLVSRPWFFDFAIKSMIPFPEVTPEEAKRFDHKNLKIVRMAGYCGCASEENFLVHLLENSPSVGTVFIDTDCDYYSDHWNNFVVMYRLRKDGNYPMIKPGRETKLKDNEVPARSDSRTYIEKFKTDHYPLGDKLFTQFDARRHAGKLRSRFTSPIVFFIT
ncbi:PREDICTED: putative FBD-associated F-box protein At5g56820 isoform X2 [Erythranthe guttata]|uniref:putative FBD-associated F-box protein At5g56820 isoform X2 n=1 Tax=Erythranthe guttata TaxID=4155 RepID=UPI00064DAE0A|nr:PREDICTED: putative FBD-associated F-box protein At5g56820 isoform X2 [Erythranthe guttata]|eukprot:XP_012849294.1 PREDICTED: putative FBD-associated F-box protein At5g56820 isoform X2 [Erythranthe guttata]